MATEQELKAQYEKLKAAREKLDSSPRNADGTITVNGKKISSAEFKALMDDAKSKESTAKKNLAQATTLAKRESKRRDRYVLQLEDQRKGYIQTVAALSNQIEKGFSPNPEEAQTRIDAANAEIAKIDAVLSAPVITPVFDDVGQAVVTSVAATPAPPVEGMTAAQQEGLRRRGQVAGGFGRTAPRTPTGPTGPKETVRTGQKPTGPTGPKTQKLPDNWEAKFREMFPGQSWWLDIDRAKYPDVVEVLKRGVLNEAWKTPEAQTRFVAEFNNTSFYKELASTGKVRQIKQLIGDAGFDSVPFNDFVTKAMNLGWDNDTLKFEAYKEAFRKDDTGQFVNPTAVTRIKKSNDYLGIANIGKAYFNQVSDDTIQRTLTGEMTTEDVQRQQREVAKARYGHLSPLIDQGLTLDEISGSFKTAAAQLLEVDPNTIDMSNAQYEVALNFGEEGKKRVMTNGEWQKLLRTDARYGWDKTENAKREARELANTISQAFGRII